MDAWNAVDILVAEDDDMDAELILRGLRKIGVTSKLFRVVDGADALSFLFREDKFSVRDFSLPRLLLLDLHMPKIGGIDVLRRVRESRATKDIPVGILTSSTSHTDFFQTQEMLVWDYLMKPVSAEALVDLVRQSGLMPEASAIKMG